jgi:hypothetical protein
VISATPAFHGVQLAGAARAAAAVTPAAQHKSSSTCQLPCFPLYYPVHHDLPGTTQAAAASCALCACVDCHSLPLPCLLPHPADCAPGLAMDANKDCKPCTAGKFCLGGDLTLNPNNQETECPDGLITTFSGAKSRAQCFTKPGYGRVSASGKVTLQGSSVRST